MGLGDGGLGLTVTQTVPRCPGGGGLAYRVGLRNSHITGPIRGQGKGARHYGARGPRVRQSRPCKPGEPAGGPGPFKWLP